MRGWWNSWGGSRRLRRHIVIEYSLGQAKHGIAERSRGRPFKSGRPSQSFQFRALGRTHPLFEEPVEVLAALAFSELHYLLRSRPVSSAQEILGGAYKIRPVDLSRSIDQC